MKLAHVRIKDFRSFGGEHEFDISSGANFFVGPNNCGKSNLVRALELALDPDADYQPSKDRPVKENAWGAPPSTRITLTFEVGSSQPEKTLLKRAQAYERAVRATRGVEVSERTSTFSDEGQIRVVTTFTPKGARQTTFQAKASGASALAADSDEHVRLEKQFRSVVRFAVIHSGEDLNSLLKGKFREILQLVIQDHLGIELGDAEQARQKYLASLQTELLEPLRSKVLERVQGMFPEIRLANLVPDVPRVVDTLSSVDIQLGDLAVTQLLDKGTGVRGAVLVSMLQYMAEQSRRSLVLAVEEPEAFLHPAGQEHIGTQLLELANRSDVSLIVTTHSPYVIAREATARVTELRKDRDGVTRNAGSACGSDDRTERLGSLYRDAGMASVIERALNIPVQSRGVLITEGYTDGQFLRWACDIAGRAELMNGIHVISANGAGKVIFQAVLAKSATDLPVVALLDHDDQGREAQKQLESFGWTKKQEILSLLTWPGRCNKSHDVEIEHLLPTRVTEKISSRVGDHAIDGSIRCGDQWHVEYSKAWKDQALIDLPTVMRGIVKSCG